MSDENLKQIVHQVSGGSATEEKNKGELVQVVVFELDSEEYAVKITDIREIIKIPDITEIPNAPHFIRGIFNLRGKIVVTLDLEKRFNLVRENGKEPKHIIIIEVGGNNFGVTVDEVKEVLRVPKENIKPTPELVSAKIHAEYLSGVIVFDEKENTNSRIIVMLDLLKLLEDKELLELGDSIKKIN
jgi:purine-binding chemotaxis protein CheW